MNFGTNYKLDDKGHRLPNFPEHKFCNLSILDSRLIKTLTLRRLPVCIKYM